MLEENRLEDTYEDKNPLTKFYFRLKVLLAIRIAKLRKEDIILDFGCGGGWLERQLKDYLIYGYDINPEKTFIKDYREIKPTKIFVLDVFEHIPIEEIKKILDNFKKLNDNLILIVSLPTENFISRKIRKLVGKTEVPAEHITKCKDIIEILKDNLRLKKKINFFSISYILLFEYEREEFESK